MGVYVCFSERPFHGFEVLLQNPTLASVLLMTGLRERPEFDKVPAECSGKEG